MDSLRCLFLCVSNNETDDAGCMYFHKTKYCHNISTGKYEEINFCTSPMRNKCSHKELLYLPE